jgi:hypothetical protein
MCHIVDNVGLLIYLYLRAHVSLESSGWSSKGGFGYRALVSVFFKNHTFVLKCFWKTMQVDINIWYALAAKYIYMFSEQKRKTWSKIK